jgi:hypothetical protein
VKGFPYKVQEDLLGLQMCRQIAGTLDDTKGWKLHSEKFFSQYDNILAEVGTTASLAMPLQALHEAGRLWIEEDFATVLGDRFSVTAHRLHPGQYIGCHNDSPSFDRGRRENYRLIYFLDENYFDEKGGVLLLHQATDGKPPFAGFRPIGDTAVLMELSDFSNHSVTEVKSGIRETAVVSYWGYPLLEDDDIKNDCLARCLKLLLSAGLERIEHSGSTFLDHLYGVYRILNCCGADTDLRLAGLFHAVLGRVHTGIAPSSIYAEDIVRICGKGVLELVEAFALYGGHEPLSDDYRQRLELLDIANCLEQADDLAQICDVERMLADCVELSAQAREVIETELFLRRDVLTKEAMSYLD